MFRNPRENANSGKVNVKPSTGRAPTPPNGNQTPHQTTTSMVSRGSTKPLTPSSKSNMPSSNKQGAKKILSSSKALKTPSKANSSILSFFKKVDNPLQDDSIFMSQQPGQSKLSSRTRSASPDPFDALMGDVDADEQATASERFNEAVGPLKRRKTSNEDTPNGTIDTEEDRRSENSPRMRITADSPLRKKCSPLPPIVTPVEPKPKPKRKRRTGPFFSDSDTNDEADSAVVQRMAVQAEKRELDAVVDEQAEDESQLVQTKPVDQVDIHENRPTVPEVEISVSVNQVPTKRYKKVPVAEAQRKWEALQPARRSLSPEFVEPPEESSGSEFGSVNKSKKAKKTKKKSKKALPPFVKKEETSIDEWGKFDDLEEFPDDAEYMEGEEFVEKKWIQEQDILEAAENVDAWKCSDYDPDAQEPNDEAMTEACPICAASLSGITPDEATRHVNGCLDGKPVPLPTPTLVPEETLDVRLMPPEARNRFARKASIARPGQANPFEFGSGSCAASSSAFSKLMSGKAEDAAWENAAAAEQSSRGKPAYQRTCPFYKIMPGFSICVDAFRYGAVKGCNAYFLSHFHSDHYIGLTSSWCHGPIYCSKVTANLVKQQLRVDPKYVIALEFEARFEVPGTQGVDITMIPANHCPGSSLFLFEKVIGKGANPKVQRILHCGDFRACPAHIAHPLLMPDICNTITGKAKQHKIDVCYLDTTYLNPKYSFPSQTEVIKACADMCVSLRKERAEESDAWEVTKRERAGAGMTKFVNSAIKPADDSIAMSLASPKGKCRGRLLVICGTYSIGKERICMGIARALDCKIWAPPGKMRICAALEDPELMSRLTDNPREAQIHMQMLMEIRAETLQEYLNSYKPHFSRIVGFRPSGWNYRPPNSRLTDSPSISTILRSPNWRSTFTMAELVPQRGSTREASCFGVPYSEHSSFRELTMFVCALRIEKVVPTVNVGSAAGRAKMKGWIERWMAERRKNGIIKIGDGEGEVKW